MSIEKLGKPAKISKWWIIGIIVVGALLRLAFLGRGELIGDEPMYIVRSIGWIDTLASDNQTTPYDWFTKLPWWTAISFHDHPPLVFAVYYAVMALLGVGVEVARVGSALFGIASVGLLYVVGKKLYDPRVGLISAALFATGAFAVFFARVAMMESIAVFFILVSVWLFLQALERPKYLVWWGASVGLSLLAKYNAFALLPVFGYFISTKRPEYWRGGRLYLALGVAVVVFSPVLIYNFNLFQFAHHFDVQFASLFHQATPEWTSLLGKEQRGSLWHRIAGLSTFATTLSPLFFVVSVAGIWGALVSCFRRSASFFADGLALGSLASFLALTLVSGSASRFLYYAVPFLCLLAAKFLAEFFQLKKRVVIIVLLILFSYEILYTINSDIRPGWTEKLGPKFLTYAPTLLVRDRAVLTLDRYLTMRLQGQAPAIQAQTSKPALNEAIHTYAEEHPRLGAPAKAVLVYDPRVEIRTLLWVFAKRSLYEGWPIMAAQTVSKNVSDFITHDITLYYVHTTEHTVRNASSSYSGFDPDEFSQKLNRVGAASTTLYTREGLPAFFVYTLKTSDLKSLASSTRK